MPGKADTRIERCIYRTITGYYVVETQVKTKPVRVRCNTLSEARIKREELQERKYNSCTPPPSKYIYIRDGGAFKVYIPKRASKLFRSLDEAKAYRDEMLDIEITPKSVEANPLWSVWNGK